MTGLENASLPPRIAGVRLRASIGSAGPVAGNGRYRCPAGLDRSALIVSSNGDGAIGDANVQTVSGCTRKRAVRQSGQILRQDNPEESVQAPERWTSALAFQRVQLLPECQVSIATAPCPPARSGRQHRADVGLTRAPREGIGAPEICYAISTDAHLDGKTVTLRDAITRIIGAGHGTVLSCVPGHLGYFEGEDSGARYVLERSGTSAEDHVGVEEIVALIDSR